MAKTTGPLMSLDARGSVAKTLTFSNWKGISYVRQRVVPAYRRTTSQGKIRDIVKDASEAWKMESTVGSETINTAYKTAYALAASGFAYSGFNLFIKECVRKNGGITYNGTLVIPEEPGDVL
jgi:hypothetical protein